MEVENVNVKNWKSLIKPSKLDVQISDDLTHAKIVAEPVASIKHISFEQVATSTTANFNNFFLYGKN